MCGSKLQNKRRLNFAYRLTTLSHADAQELEQQQQKSLMVKKVKKNTLELFSYNAFIF